MINPGFSMYLSIYLSIYLSTYLFIYLSVYLSIYLSIYIDRETEGDQGEKAKFVIHSLHYLEGSPLP